MSSARNHETCRVTRQEDTGFMDPARVTTLRRRPLLWLVLLAFLLAGCSGVENKEKTEELSLINAAPDDREAVLATLERHLPSASPGNAASTRWAQRLLLAGLKREWGSLDESYRDFRKIRFDIQQRVLTAGLSRPMQKALLIRSAYEEGYLTVLLNDREGLTALTNWALQVDDPELQYQLLKDAFVILHLFHSSDLATYKRVLARAQALSARRRSPDEGAWLRGLQAYADFQAGDVRAVHEAIEDLKWLETNPLIRAGESVAGAFGWFTDLRAVSHAMAGYGYARLGQYEDAATHFKQAGEASEAARNKGGVAAQLRDWIALAEVDAVLLPTRMPNAHRLVDSALTQIDAALGARSDLERLSASPYLRAAEHYPGVVALRSYRLAGRNADALRISKALFDLDCDCQRPAVPPMHAATPKGLVAEAVYQSALTDPSAPYLSDVLATADALMADYQGYEQWKIEYAKSMVQEKSSPTEALASARRAVRALDRYARDRFPDLGMQATFWEDKQVAYDRYVKLLARKAGGRTDQRHELLWAIDQSNLRSPAAQLATSGFRAMTRALQSRLKPVDRLVMWWYDDDLLLRVVVNGESLHLQQTDLPGRMRRELEQGIELARSELLVTGAAVQEPVASQNLANNLLDGIDLATTPDATLYIVPNRALHSVAWNALPVQRAAPGPTYLVDHAEIVVLPSISRAQAADRAPRGAVSENRAVDVLIGETKEARALKQVLAASDCCDVASRAGLKASMLERLERPGSLIVHSHAAFGVGSAASGVRPMEWGITFKRERASEKLMLTDIVGHFANKSFVFLSGCGTGIVGSYTERVTGKRSVANAGESIIGAYRVLLEAGVPTLAVCTADQILDEDSLELVKRLAPLLRAGEQPGTALRAAMLDYRRAKTAPGSWGQCQILRSTF